MIDEGSIWRDVRRTQIFSDGVFLPWFGMTEEDRKICDA